MPTGVIVPVHGFAPFLTEALDALLATSPDAVVVVDDGSRLPIALDGEHAERVTLVRREVAGGPAVARAAGLEALDASVDLVALCDADDAWSPVHLDAHRAALSAAPDAGWSFGRARIVGPDGRETGERWDEPAVGIHDAAAFARSLFVANPVPTSSVVMRRAALEAVGGFAGPVRVAEDWELWLRLCRGGFDAVCVPDARIAYRRHPESLTADVAGLARDQLAVHAAHAELVDDETRRAVEAADRAALAAGLARAGDASGAREAWDAVARLRPLSRAEQARRAALTLPGVRALVGRRGAY